MTPNPKSTSSDPRRKGGGDPINQFATIVWKIGDPVPTKLWFDTPIEALTTGVEYLKAGWQVRLSDGTVRYFADLPQPDETFAAATTANGQLAALTGPPRIKGRA